MFSVRLYGLVETGFSLAEKIVCDSHKVGTILDSHNPVKVALLKIMQLSQHIYMADIILGKWDISALSAY